MTSAVSEMREGKRKASAEGARGEGQSYAGQA